MSDLAGELGRGRLTWWPEIGVGFFPVENPAAPYNEDYFERVRRNADTDIGRALMNARCEFVNTLYRDHLVDVGIGSGAFIERRNELGFETAGYDVNPMAIAWLRTRQLFADPYVHSYRAVSLWDVLEHIADFRPLLANVTEWLFVSIPIFDGPHHVLRSKHLRRDEHYWYFSKGGLVRMMQDFGFRLVEYSDVETKIGREDILSFAFRRS